MSKTTKSINDIKLAKVKQDEEVQAGNAADPDTKNRDKAVIRKAKRGRPFLPEGKKKQQVTMLLDPDIIAELKKGGRGWQTRANAALRRQLGL